MFAEPFGKRMSLECFLQYQVVQIGARKLMTTFWFQEADARALECLSWKLAEVLVTRLSVVIYFQTKNLLEAKVTDTNF